jgi:hypothetical protein
MFVPFSKKEAERMHEDVLHPIASLRQAATAFTSSVEEVEVRVCAAPIRLLHFFLGAD